MDGNAGGVPIGMVDANAERGLDDAAVESMLKGKAVEYEEKEVDRKAEIVAAIKTVGRCNLFLFGQAPPVAALLDRTDCPELGPMGSYLAAAESLTTSLVLVIKQYDPANVAEESGGTVQDSPVTPVEERSRSDE